MHITVLGATGGIGRAIAVELLDRGHEVVAASRTAATAAWPDGVQPRTTDLRDPASAAAACRGADVVVMAAQVPYTGWVTELPALFDAAVDAAAGADARLVVVDNLYAYGAPDGPMTEASPPAASTTKGRLRAAIGQRMLDAHRADRCPVTIGRFSDYYGLDAANSLVNRLGIQPAVAGRTVRTFIAADQIHTFHYLPDAARGFATLAEQPLGDGRTWILPAAPAITQGALYELLGQVLGRRLRVRNVTPRMLALLGLVNAELRESREMAEQFARPYVTDASAFTAAFGPIELTPHRDALTATVATERARTAGRRTTRTGRTEGLDA